MKTPELKESGQENSGHAAKQVFLFKISSIFSTTIVSASKKQHASNSVSLNACSFVYVTGDRGSNEKCNSRKNRINDQIAA